RVNILQNQQANTLLTVLFFILFVTTAIVTAGDLGLRLDESAGNWAANNTASALQSIMKYISIIGSTEVILLATGLIGLILLIKRNWKAFFLFFVLSLGGVLLNLVTKLIVQRARPGD